MLPFLLFLGLIDVCYSAHRSKFRSCSSSGFCSRQRELNSILYYLDSTSARVTRKNEFTAILNSLDNDETKKLFFSVSRVINTRVNVLKLFVTEHQQNIRKRYQVNDVITENGRKAIPFNYIKQTENESILGWNDKYEMVIQYNPFKMMVRNNGINEILINEFDKFYFEPYRNRKKFDCGEHDNDSVAKLKCEEELNIEKDLWEEKFSSHTYHYDDGPASIGLDFTFIETKNVYGIPEHATEFSLKTTVNDNSDNSYDQPYRLWNLDVFEYELDVPDSLYGAIPYIIGHNNKNTNSILWLNAAETYIDVAEDVDTDNKNIRWMSESGVMECFILLHENSNNDNNDEGYLYQYYLLTGFPQLPPISALGHHQCRWNYNDIADVKSISDEFDLYNIPNDFIWLDIEHTDGKRYFTWDKYNFESPHDMLSYIELSGRKMVTIVDPHIKKDDDYYIFSEINNLDLWVKNRDNLDYSGWCWPGDSRYPDFTNPLMREYWSKQFNYNKYQYSSKVLFTWNDMNEPSVFDGPEVTMPVSNIHFNGIRHNEIHNLYGYYVHSATFNGLLERDNNKLRPFVLSRSFFSGSQKYGAIWTGDNTASWEHLAMSLPMLLSMSVSGLGFVGADVGGFFNNPDGELMARWYEFGVYYPFFRNHAHQDTKRREFWEFDDQYSVRMKHSILTRYRMLPYIYTLFYLSSSKSHPIMQPLWYKFNNDQSTFNREDAFMFGDAFYVQPIVESNIHEIDINLPQNNNNDSIFYEISSTPNKINIYKGGLEYHLVGYSSRIPVLRYGGTITIEKHRIRRSSLAMKYDPITVIIALDSNDNAQGFHYFDDGESLSHINKNQYIFQQIHYIGKQHKIINKIIHNNDDSTIPDVEIERIVIMGQDIHHLIIKHVVIKQNNISRKTKQFGIAQNTLVIRKPQILVNSHFEIIVQIE